MNPGDSPRDFSDSLPAFLADLPQQPQTYAQIQRMVEKDRLPHGMLFHGPDGVGKYEAALRLAACLVSDNLSSRDENLRRIAADAHPDARVFRPRRTGNRNLRVADLRENLMEFAEYAPFSSKRAVVIFDEADIALPPSSPASINLLLKTIEEPRKNQHYIFISSRPHVLLPTIRSRLQPLRFASLKKEELRARLVKQSDGMLTDDQIFTISHFARGSLRSAKNLIDNEVFNDRISTALELDRLIQQGAVGDLFRAAERLATSESHRAALSDLQLLLCATPKERAQIQATVSDRTPPSSTTTLNWQSHEVFFEIERSLEYLYRNGNPKIVIADLFFSLAARRDK